MISEYEEFLKKKVRRITDAGFDCNNLNNKMFDFQKHMTRIALKKGKFALFADCGLGKTLMQLEWANQVSRETKKPTLILSPLAVAGQTIEEGEKFGIEVSPYGSGKIQITNYEQLEKIETGQFSAVVLDESSILKNFQGVTKQLIIDRFQNTPYKLACTATPSPNDDMEICNHAEFLNMGPRSEILATYFVHDGGETAKWRLKGHAQNLFYKFISQWAMMVNNPSDLGFDGSKYVLPELNYITHEINTPVKTGRLFNDVNVNATNYNQELRDTMELRMQKTASIVNASKENFIIWIKQDAEGEMLRKLIPEAIEVKGSHSPQYKEEHLLGFAHNKFRVLITKAKIAQFGLNYQNCHNQIFPSLDFSYEGLYQSIRRSWRFGQLHPVNIHIVVMDTMRNVIQSIKNKEQQFETMKFHLANQLKQAA
jgi:hypothetical protein